MLRKNFVRLCLNTILAGAAGQRATSSLLNAGAPPPGSPNSMELGPAGNWILACAHEGSGKVLSGSLEKVSSAASRGADLLAYLAPSHHQFEESVLFYETYWNVEGGFAGFWSGPTTDLLESDDSDLGSESFYRYSASGASRIYWGAKGVNERVMPQNHFDVYRWYVRDNWKVVYEHNEDGQPVSGSVKNLKSAIRDGLSLKAGVKNLFGLDDQRFKGPDHWVFFSDMLNLNYLTASQSFVTYTSRRSVITSRKWPLVMENNSFHPVTVHLKTSGEIGLQLESFPPHRYGHYKLRRPVRWLVSPG